MFSRRPKDSTPETRLIRSIRKSTIGHRHRIVGSHYTVPLLHADSTASGTSLLGLEEMIVLGVMPTYANTHSEASWTSQQTNRFREDARRWIMQSVNAPPDSSLIFTGAGTTAAIDKLINMIGLRVPQQLERRYSFQQQISPSERPVVFIGPYEHHSNDLPWRASIAEVVQIPEDSHGNIDESVLESALRRYADRPLKIGSFSAASNVTGIVSDTVAITALLKRHGAFSCWDYAAAAPHLRVDMRDKDAIFMSPHKLPGGAGTPGVLVVRHNFVRRPDLHDPIPAVPGGGTVDFVGPDAVDYTRDLSHREEGGTPAIIESIRAGLTFRLKDAVGLDLIKQREWTFLQRCLQVWRQVPQINILRDTGVERVSTISFTVSYRQEGNLHHNFVVALLNDLFGIQARAGCSCTGPYGHLLFNYSKEKSEAFRKPILQGYEGIKPGWVRISLNYLHTVEEVGYIAEAVRLVATMGHYLLPDYKFSPEAGSWTNIASPRRPVTLDELWVQSGAQSKLQTGSKLKARLARTVTRRPLSTYLEKATKVLRRAAQRPPVAYYEKQIPHVTDAFNEQRWFPLPVGCLEPAPVANLTGVRMAPLASPTSTVFSQATSDSAEGQTPPPPALAGFSTSTLSTTEPTTPALSPMTSPTLDSVAQFPSAAKQSLPFAPLVINSPIVYS